MENKIDKKENEVKKSNIFLKNDYDPMSWIVRFGQFIIDSTNDNIMVRILVWVIVIMLLAVIIGAWNPFW